VAADQLSKWVVRARVDDLPAELALGLRVDVTYNSGISFSRFAGAGSIVIVLVACVAAGVAVALVLAPPRYRPALGVILGGAVGNLIDRVRLGHVVDFILFHTQSWSFAVFNFADSFITIGAGLIILDEVLETLRHRRKDGGA
jgi:signal peptidase II